MMVAKVVDHIVDDIIISMMIMTRKPRPSAADLESNFMFDPVECFARVAPDCKVSKI